MNNRLLETKQPIKDLFTKDLLKVAGLALILVLLLHGLAATNFIILFMDGAYYLFGIIEGNGFFLVEPTSRTVQVLQQIPVVLTLRLGVSDLEILMVVAALSNLLLPLLLTASCYWILPSGHKAFFIFPLLHYLTGTLASWFPTVTDAPPAAAYFWMLFYLVLFRSNTWWSALLCVLMALPALYLHEAMSFLSLLLVSAALWRFKNASSWFFRVLFLFLSGWFLFISYIQLTAILYPRDINNRSGFLAQLLELKWIYWDGINIAVVLSIATVGLLLWVFIDNLLHNSNSKRSVLAQVVRRSAPFLLGGVTLAVWSLLLFDIHWYGLIPQFAARALAAFVTVPLAILVLLSLFQPSIQRGWYDRLHVVLVVVLTLGILVSHGIGLSRWVDYVRDFRSLLQSQTGFIPFDKAVNTLPLDHRKNFWHITRDPHWTNPVISYLLSPQGRVTTIVSNPHTARWQPFDPLDHVNLPRRNFEITSYLEATSAQYCAGKKYYGHAQFNRLGRFGFISEIEGLHSRESWGRWSDGGQVVFRFKKPLPDRFTLIVDIRALGPNIGMPVTVSAGTTQTTFTAQAQPQSYTLAFTLTEPIDTLVFTVPKPVRPRDLGIGDDMRWLGLGFSALRICTN